MDAVQFENVYFSYERGEEADIFAEQASCVLRNVNFSVREGEFVAVLGHNGSGKSTLARLTNGLLTPDSGTIRIFGETAEENTLFDIRKQVGVVFQNPDNQTVASIVEDDIAFGPENIGVPRAEIGERIAFALEAVCMQAYRHATTARLSGGQKQRIAIAGVLALKPRIMILDEATAMLDPRGRKEVMDVVLRLNKEEGITVLLITHFPEEALLADRAIALYQGEIVLEGTPQEVFERTDVLEKYSLVVPRPVRICRALTERGVPVADCMDAETIAERLLQTLPVGDFSGTDGAGMRSTQKETSENSGRIACENLSYVYNERTIFATAALKNVGLDVYPGDFFGIIGHTGSGKSTFVQHLNALIKVASADKKYKAKKPKKGQPLPPKTLLSVNGFDLTDKNTDFRALRRTVGVVFQYPEQQLFAETVFDDVAFGYKNFYPEATATELKEAVQAALERVGLCYADVKGRSPFDLSGGQRRRVAIAGVIVTKPEILVLDEPAAGLDPLGKEAIMRLLHELHGDWCKTVVIVSHDMDEIAENCNRAAVFADGCVQAVATPSELFGMREMLLSHGLDVPFTAKITHALAEKGVRIKTDYTEKDFIEKTLAYACSCGVGVRSTGGAENA